MARRLKRTDVVIVGLGAAGGLAALPLTRAGLEVVGIEAGGRVGVKDLAPDELRSIRNWLGRGKANLEVPTIRLKPTDVAVPLLAETAARQFGLTMNAVGGSTVHWTGLSWRLHPWNFRTRSEAIRRDGPGAIPPGSTVADWPVSYGELEPWYDKVEYLFGISGKAGTRSKHLPVSGQSPTTGFPPASTAASARGWAAMRTQRPGLITA